MCVGPTGMPRGAFCERNSLIMGLGLILIPPLNLLWFIGIFLLFFTISLMFQQFFLFHRMPQNLTCCCIRSNAVYPCKKKILDIMRKSGVFSKNLREVPKMKKEGLVSLCMWPNVYTMKRLS